MYGTNNFYDPSFQTDRNEKSIVYANIVNDLLDQRRYRKSQQNGLLSIIISLSITMFETNK